MNIGVIGLGEVSQLMHLPILQDLCSEYTLQAVSDIAPSLVEYIGKKYHVPQTYLSAEELLEKADIEAVFVLSPDQYHGRYIRLALERGLHVFVEKPVTLCAAELRELIELHKAHAGQVVMVGFMRRYAPGFLKMKELLAEPGRPTEYLRFRDIICEGPFYIGQTRPIFYPADVPADKVQEGSALRRKHLDMAIGQEATDSKRTTYQMMTGLGCHSFSAVRELLGSPKRVVSVTTAAGGQHVVAVLEYEGFLGVYELLNNQQVVQFDAAIEVYQQDRKLKLKYETPYVRHQPATLEVTESDARDTKTTLYGPDYRDAFHTELLEFAACIGEGRQPKTTLADALDDLLLFEDLVKRIEEVN